MHQRCCVQHLYDGAKPNPALRLAAQRLGGEQKQRRTNALSTAGHQIGGDVGDDLNGRCRLGRELLLNGSEVVTEKV